jgi:hypothetical protein
MRDQARPPSEIAKGSRLKRFEWQRASHSARSVRILCRGRGLNLPSQGGEAPAHTRRTEQNVRKLVHG